MAREVKKSKVEIVAVWSAVMVCLGVVGACVDAVLAGRFSQPASEFGVAALAGLLLIAGYTLPRRGGRE